MTKDAYYFSHDSNARNDPDVIQMRMVMGWRGYGMYWAIVEMLRDEEGYKMRTDYDCIAFALHEDSQAVKGLVEDFGLFTVEDGLFWSESLLRRMKKANNIRKKLSQAGRKGGLSKARAGLKQGSGDAVAIKGKERKGNKRKEPSGQGVHLAGLLLDSILKWKPDHKKPTGAQLNSWAIDIDRIISLDGRSPSLIESVIRWLPTDDFWPANVRSGAKLRKQFDTLEAKMKGAKPKPKYLDDNPRRPPNVDLYELEMEKQRKREMEDK